MDSRAQFEDWYYDQFGQFEECDRSEVFDIEENDYYRLGTRLGWSAWQASRAAIEVELPAYRDATTHGFSAFNDALDICETELRKHGIRIKEEPPRQH